MEYESIADLDEQVIVKLDKFYKGNIFIDEGMVAVCRFDSFLHELDVSEKKKLDLSVLFDLFEDDFSEVYDQIVEFYEYSDILNIGQDILSTIPNKNVFRFCGITYKQLENEHDIQLRIDLLNKLISDSKLSPENLPLPLEKCIYHTKRSLFEIRNKKSRKMNAVYRFTIAKRVYEYLSNKEFNHTIRIEKTNSQILFHVSEIPRSENIMVKESRSLFSNSDGSVRTNIPPSIYLHLSKTGVDSHICIELEDGQIQFIVCE